MEPLPRLRGPVVSRGGEPFAQQLLRLVEVLVAARLTVLQLVLGPQLLDGQLQALHVVLTHATAVTRQHATQPPRRHDGRHTPPCNSTRHDGRHTSSRNSTSTTTRHGRHDSCHTSSRNSTSMPTRWPSHAVTQQPSHGDKQLNGLVIMLSPYVIL